MTTFPVTKSGNNNTVFVPEETWNKDSDKINNPKNRVRIFFIGGNRIYKLILTRIKSAYAIIQI